MILYEHEGKTLLQFAGITVPKSQLLTKENESVTMFLPCVLKAQTLSGKRAKAGWIIKVGDKKEILPALHRLFGQSINGELIKNVLVEEQIQYEEEWYVSFSYNPETRCPVIIVSSDGGSGVEEQEKMKEIFETDIRISSLPAIGGLPAMLMSTLFKLFLDQDCLLLEINPLVKTSVGWMALDAKIKLDDNASNRHPEWAYTPRLTSGHQITDREIAAKQIDQDDHRGTAGSSYLDLDGDIAVLASGGGASLVAMDALIAAGGRPANYTEYSGNPPREKVIKLTKIVLSKPGLHGLWIVGALANFTDIYETLSGIISGLRQAEKSLGRKFDFPIVIRRGGPYDEKAFAMLKEVKDFDLTIYGPTISIAESAKAVVQLSKDYGSRV